MKKLFIRMMAVILAVSNITILSHAQNEEVHIVGVGIPGYTLSTNLGEYAAIEWRLYADESTDDYTVVGTGESYMLKNSDGGKYIAAVSGAAASGRISVEQAISDRYPYVQGQVDIGDTAPADNVLFIGGRSFSYVYATQDDRYYMVANEVYGATRGLTPEAAELYFSPNLARFDETLIFQDLQRLYNKGAGGTINGPGGFAPLALPKAMLPYIDVNAQWIIERGAVNPQSYDGVEIPPTIPNDYVITAPMGCLSYYELVKYKERLGLSGNYNVWLRTPANSEATPDSKSLKNQLYLTPKKNVMPIEYTQYIYIRPSFFISRDFFKDIAIDVENSGKELLDIIKDTVALEDMRKVELYDEDELARIYGFEPPKPLPEEEREIRYTGVMRPGAILGLDYIPPEGEEATYQWYLIDGNSEQKISEANTPRLTLLNDWTGKGVKCKITLSDLIIWTKPATILTPYFNQSSSVNPGAVFGNSEDYTALGPESNKFQVDGKSFSIIEKNEEGDYLVLANNTYGTAVIDRDPDLVVPNTPLYDPQKEGNIGRLVDGLYRGETIDGGDALPDTIRAHIVPNRVWITERAQNAAKPLENGTIVQPSIPNDYPVVASVVLPSAWEILIHYRRIGYGYADGTPGTWGNSWWTRTPYAAASLTTPTYKVVHGTLGVITTSVYTSSFQIRPMFYLDSSFFKETKLELSSMGDEIREIIQNSLSFEDLFALYGEEIEYLGYSVIKNISISGIPGVGRNLAASYELASRQGETDDNVSLQWYSAAAPEGPYSKIDGETRREYQITQNQQECYIRLGVTLNNQQGSAIEFFSEPTSIVEEQHSTSNGGNGGSGGSGGGGGVYSGSGGRPSIGATTGAYEVTGLGERLIQENDGFTDLDEVPWAQEAIAALCLRGIVNGKGNRVFDPHAVVTREEFVKMLVNALKIDTKDISCSYNDVDETAWYYPYVAAGTDKGLVVGREDGSFGVGDSVIRQDACVFAYRALKTAGTPAPGVGEQLLESFADAESIELYARESIAFLCSIKILTGDENGRLEPQRACTRAEAAKLTYSLLTYIEQKKEA